MNKKVLKETIKYYETSQDAMKKQAEEINYLKYEKNKLLTKFASYIDNCVKIGDVPEYLSNAIKQTFVTNPSSFVDFIEKKASFVKMNKESMELGKPKDLGLPKKDILSEWANM